MTFREFNAMMADRQARRDVVTLPSDEIELFTEVCVHPFNTLGLMWRARAADSSITVIVDYRCPSCHEMVGSARRRIRTNR
jgi:hypothetical protein